MRKDATSDAAGRDESLDAALGAALAAGVSSPESPAPGFLGAVRRRRVQRRAMHVGLTLVVCACVAPLLVAYVPLFFWRHPPAPPIVAEGKDPSRPDVVHEPATLATLFRLNPGASAEHLVLADSSAERRSGERAEALPGI